MKTLADMTPQEVWLTAKTFTYKLRQKGYDVTPERLRKWAERRKIRARKLDGRKNVYEVSNVREAICRNPD
ncbi:hypothetical protein [Corynebacterium sp. ACRPS]|uniref:hypothetical protein n=1 Tax=Corynebacterium sp. ACRPS TaxID=2918194 RepID=UPI001EF6EF08|nr:hypothetical protein [Corynebacterium sp. ACRPS]